jgi:RpiR family carbohydrate utilization transcriptional regulator
MAYALIAGLRSKASSMTPAPARVAERVLAAPDSVLYQSVTELADDAKSSEASVIRFCRELRFFGFQGFKLALARELASESRPESNDDDSDAIGKLVDTAITALRETAQLLDRAALDAAATRILKAPQVEIFGVAASAVTAQYLSYKLTRIGVRSRAQSDAHIATMVAETSDKRMLHIIVSSSGSTMDTVRVAKLA